MKKVVGCAEEIAEFETLAELERPSLVVMRDSHRIGKTTLAAECVKGEVFLPFSGLAPQETAIAQDQLDTFAYQLSCHFKLPNMTFRDWYDAFSALENYLVSEPTVILFDEISWMGEKDPTFVSKFITWWAMLSWKGNFSWEDRPWILILRSSVSNWIEENIIRDIGFGRISVLPPLSFVPKISYVIRRKSQITNKSLRAIQDLHSY